MAIFAVVVDEGSFRAAASRARLAPSRISEVVSALEAHLGVTLLYRTTRKLSLTHEGRVLYAHVSEMLRSAESGLNEITLLAQKPVGELKVSLPAFVATGDVTKVIADFVRRYPEVKLSLSYSNQAVDLVDAGFDVSVRVGWLKDSSMMSRKIGEFERLLVCGADYARANPKPSHPDELRHWDWISFRMRPNATRMQSAGGAYAEITGEGRIEVDSLDALVDLARQNLGVTILPAYLAEPGFRTGELVMLLPEWKLEPVSVYALWPDGSRRENLVRLFVRHLAEHGVPPHQR